MARILGNRMHSSAGEIDGAAQLLAFFRIETE